MLWKEIREYLEQNHISQVWLSKESKIGQVALNAILTGNRRLQLDEYLKICLALKVSLYTFIPEELRKLLIA